MTKWLLLIPTEFERNIIAQTLADFDSTTVKVCGFGPIVSAAKTTELIAKSQPDRVLLLGIAGSYSPAISIGTATQFSSVGCYGVGVGTGDQFQTAGKMGWPHWNQSETNDSIEDVISLEPESSTGQLLTVCAASENQPDVQSRLQIFPDAIAEDMEGFAVAAACKLAGMPLTIVRGISNVAGDRDKSNWKIAEALNAAVELARKVIHE